MTQLGGGERGLDIMKERDTVYEIDIGLATKRLFWVIDFKAPQKPTSREDEKLTSSY
jgi:hypothetical protein